LSISTPPKLHIALSTSAFSEASECAIPTGAPLLGRLQLIMAGAVLRSGFSGFSDEADKIFEVLTPRSPYGRTERHIQRMCI
jgi:hypothetical protein